LLFGWGGWARFAREAGASLRSEWQSGTVGQRKKQIPGGNDRKKGKDNGNGNGKCKCGGLSTALRFG